MTVMIKGEASQQRISWFNRIHTEGNLKLAPPFQRKPVWSHRNKSYLIDTIIRGLPVPEIYMQIKTDANGNSQYIVVDGQQRIRAILEFIAGNYEIREDDNDEHGNKTFKELPDGVKKDIWDYRLVVRELPTSSEEDVREIFRRLNKNVVPLNRQELRNATYMGKFITLMEKLAEDEFWAENGIMTPNAIRRMLDAEFISELFIAMMHGIQSKNADNIDNYYQLYDDNFPNRDIWVRNYNKTLEMIQQLLPDLKSTRWSNKADFYSLFIAVHELLNDYIFPIERYEKIQKVLQHLDYEVSANKEESEDPLAREYFEAIDRRTTNKENRIKRHEVIRKILIPFLISKDKRRNFNDEERRILWIMSEDKKCGICGKPVEWNDYEIDHIVPHSQGGLTELQNAQITHKSCNASKAGNT